MSGFETEAERRASEDAYLLFMARAKAESVVPDSAAGTVEEADDEDEPDLVKSETVVGDLCRADDGKFESCSGGKDEPLTPRVGQGLTPRAVADAYWDIQDSEKVTAWRRGMPEERKQALRKYAGWMYSMVNEGLRGRREMPEQAAIVAAEVSKAVAESPKFDAPVKVWRGLSVQAPVADVVRVFREHVGGEVRLSGFQSASMSRPVAEAFAGGVRSVLMEIETDRGAVVGDAGPRGEFEVLLGHDWRYTVLGVDEGKERTVVRLRLAGTEHGGGFPAFKGVPGRTGKFVQPMDAVEFLARKAEQIVGDLCRGDAGRFESCSGEAPPMSDTVAKTLAEATRNASMWSDLTQEQQAGAEAKIKSALEHMARPAVYRKLLSDQTEREFEKIVAARGGMTVSYQASGESSNDYRIAQGRAETVLSTEDAIDRLDAAARAKAIEVWNDMDPDTKFARAQVYAAEFTRGQVPLIDVEKVGVFRTGGMGAVYARAVALQRFSDEAEARGFSSSASKLRGASDKVWDEWKSSSTSPTAVLMQRAIVEEFGVGTADFSGINDRQVDGAARSFGKMALRDGTEAAGESAMRAYVRSLYDTTQHILEKDGVAEVEVYRAVYLPKSAIDAARAGDGSLSGLIIKKNGASSWTRSADVANTWMGVGKVPKDYARVVMRARVPRRTVLSVPVYGRGVHNEQEVVLLPGEFLALDAWAGKAPGYGEWPGLSRGGQFQDGASGVVSKSAAVFVDLNGGAENGWVGHWLKRIVVEKAEQIVGDLCRGEAGKFESCSGGHAGVSTATEKDVLDAANSDPDVRAARDRIRTEMTTASKYQRPDGSYVPDRARMHDDVVRGMLNPRAMAPEGRKPRMVMLLGIPASGKSKVLRAGLDGEFTVIDADAVKERLPEYDGRNASVLHKESGYVAEELLLPAAVLARHDVVLDWTGKNTEKTLHRVGQFVKLGYDVEVRHVTIPPAEAASRALRRFKTDGRFVDPEYIVKEVGGKPDRTYRALRDSGMVKSWRSYSNDVPFGSPPVLLEEGKRG